MKTLKLNVSNPSIVCYRNVFISQRNCRIGVGTTEIASYIIRENRYHFVLPGGNIKRLVKDSWKLNFIDWWVFVGSTQYEN